MLGPAPAPIASVDISVLSPSKFRTNHKVLITALKVPSVNNEVRLSLPLPVSVEPSAAMAAGLKMQGKRTIVTARIQVFRPNIFMTFPLLMSFKSFSSCVRQVLQFDFS